MRNSSLTMNNLLCYLEESIAFELSFHRSIQNRQTLLGERVSSVWLTILSDIDFCKCTEENYS